MPFIKREPLNGKKRGEKPLQSRRRAVNNRFPP